MTKEDDGHTLGNLVKMARAALAPFETALRAAFKRAWDLAQDEFATYKRWPHSRVRSNILQHRIVQEVEGVYPERMRETRGRSLMVASENVVAHFKKLDGNGRSSNFPTQLALSFAHQMNLPGFPQGVRVKVGYVTDRSHATLIDVMAVVAIGDSVLATWEINSAPAVAPGAEVINITSAKSTTAASAQPTERKKGRARKDADATKRRKAGTGSDDGNTDKS